MSAHAHMETINPPSADMASLAANALPNLASLCSEAARLLLEDTEDSNPASATIDDAIARLSDAAVRLVKFATESANEGTAIVLEQEGSLYEMLVQADDLICEFYPMSDVSGGSSSGHTQTGLFPSLKRLLSVELFDADAGSLCTFLQAKARQPDFLGIGPGRGIDHELDSEPIWDENSPSYEPLRPGHSSDVEDKLYACLRVQTSCNCDHELEPHERHLKRLTIRCPSLDTLDQQDGRIAFMVLFASSEQKCKVPGRCRWPGLCKFRSRILVGGYVSSNLYNGL